MSAITVDDWLGWWEDRAAIADEGRRVLVGCDHFSLEHPPAPEDVTRALLPNARFAPTEIERLASELGRLLRKQQEAFAGSAAVPQPLVDPRIVITTGTAAVPYLPPEVG